MPENYKNTTRYKHAKRRFEYADLNKDGQLSVHEFLYFLNPEEGKHMREVLVLVSHFLGQFIHVISWVRVQFGKNIHE